MKTLFQRLAALAATLTLALNASAGVGGASAADVTLAGHAADAFAYESGWNPHAGPHGDTSGFTAAFGDSDSFALLDKLDRSHGFGNMGPLTFGFTGATGTSGTWSVTNTGSTTAVFDLAFAIHAGNQGGAWLFGSETILPGATLTGDWRILWTVGRGSHPEFSNLTLFGRDTVPCVPEPQTWAMLLAGLALATAGARRARR